LQGAFLMQQIKNEARSEERSEETSQI